MELAKSLSLPPPILEQSQGLWQRMVDAGIGVRMSLRPWSTRSFLYRPHTDRRAPGRHEPTTRVHDYLSIFGMLVEIGYDGWSGRK